MAGVVHISDEEAARDIGALLEAARSGSQIMIEAPGRRGVMMVLPEAEEQIVPKDRMKGRTAADVLNRLSKWESAYGVLSMDEGFADDIGEAHERLNQPLDSSKWD